MIWNIKCEVIKIILDEDVVYRVTKFDDNVMNGCGWLWFMEKFDVFMYV